MLSLSFILRKIHNLSDNWSKNFGNELNVKSVNCTTIYTTFHNEDNNRSLYWLAKSAPLSVFTITVQNLVENIDRSRAVIIHTPTKNHRSIVAYSSVFIWCDKVLNINGITIWIRFCPVNFVIKIRESWVAKNCVMTVLIE